VKTAKVSVYVFSGLTAVGAGLFYSAVVTLSGSPTAGDPFLLQSFAAVVVGGTVLAGGRGGFVGTVFGALLLSVISQIVVFAGFQSYYSELAYGAILVIMVSVYSLPALIAKNRGARDESDGATAKRGAAVDLHPIASREEASCHRGAGVTPSGPCLAG